MNPVSALPSFATPLSVSGPPRSTSNISSHRPPQCNAAPESTTATLFTTGKKLLLQPQPAQNISQHHTPRFVVCPQCSFAYAANALRCLTTVRCPNCSNVFQAAPADLFVAATPTDKPSLPTQLPSDRVSCKHMPSCSGCSVSTRAAEPPVLRDVRAFLRRYALRSVPAHMHSVHHWRTHAKLAVRPSARARIALGLFRANSHQLQPIPECAVHAPEINAAAALVEHVLNRSNLRAYNEHTASGHCRYALFSVHRPSRKVQLTLVWNAASWKDANPQATALAAELWRRAPNLLHSLWFNWNASAGNSIVCPEVERFYHARGEKALVETVCGVKVAFPPYAFRQANLDAFEKLVLPTLLSYIPVAANVVEFCAGVGVIGLAALKHRQLQSLTSSEIMDGGQKAFLAALRQLRKEGVKGDANYIVGSDSETIHMVQPETQVVIVDPPRGGLSEDVVEFLASPGELHSLNRLVYLSCGFPAFRKDASLLLEGQWRLKAAHAFILFPGSNHVELLCIFDRQRKRNARRDAGHDARRRNTR